MCLPELLEGHGFARASRRRRSWLRPVVRSWKSFVGLIIVASGDRFFGGICKISSWDYIVRSWKSFVGLIIVASGDRFFGGICEISSWDYISDFSVGHWKIFSVRPQE